jgi:hypothetical protein
MINDQHLCEFLNALAVNVKRDDGVLLTEWEKSFLGSYVGLPTGAFHFTPARRQAVDRMWRKYGPDLELPHPLDRVSERPKIAEADPTGCQFLMREDGRQRRCNDPAEFVEPGRLRYCRQHGEQATADCKRAGITLRLIKFP